MRHPVLAPRLATVPLLLIAGCVAAPPPPKPAPQPTVARPSPMAAPAPLAADWRDWPQTPGSWTYDRDARGTRAMYGTAGADARVVLRCDQAARQVYLSRAGSVATPLTIRTSSTARTLAVRPTGGAQPYVAAALAPNDALLDAMGFSRGRFVIEQAGAAPLVLPAWAEIERVTEDCRG